MKLYYGGFGDYMEFTVAENETDAIKNVGIKINAPFLPITVTEIAEIDGYAIKPMSQIEALIKECGQHPATQEEIKEVVTETRVEAEEVIKTYHCKHVDCEFTAHSPIELAQHSRKEHPKGD